MGRYGWQKVVAIKGAWGDFSEWIIPPASHHITREKVETDINPDLVARGLKPLKWRFVYLFPPPTVYMLETLKLRARCSICGTFSQAFGPIDEHYLCREHRFRARARMHSFGGDAALAESAYLARFIAKKSKEMRA
jgi:hypothetical protein